jgi:16S rRNA processing protein RimM
MDFIYLGKIVNTHGIKGEIRILSDFDHKELVFVPKFHIYVDKEEFIIKTYRVHKNYDMVTLEGITDINDALRLKGKNVYINRDDVIGIIFDEDYIDLEVYTDHLIGKVSDIRKGIKYDFLVIKGKKEYLVPKIDEFVKNIDFDNKKIYLNDIKGLIDED